MAGIRGASISAIGRSRRGHRATTAGDPEAKFAEPLSEIAKRAFG